MSEAVAEDVSGRPHTGDPAVDAIVADVADLDGQPLAEHHDRLARAHERLHGELGRDADALRAG